MNTGRKVVLDACVLVNAALRDTLLRLAEKHLYLPCWSDQIMAEVVRTLQGKLGKTPQQTVRLVGELRIHFGKAWVREYEPLISGMTNQVKDRHVLAAAVHANAQTLVTFNLRDFPFASCQPWQVEVQHPDKFLVDLCQRHPATVIQCQRHPATVIQTLQEQAQDIGRTLPALLRVKRQGVPQFVSLIAQQLSLDM